MEKIICEEFDLNFIEAKNKYNCCFTEKDFQTGKYDFYYILQKDDKNHKMYNELLVKYNSVQVLTKGFLVSNQYSLINFKKIKIYPTSQGMNNRKKVLTNTYAIRFMKKYQRDFIFQNMEYLKSHKLEKYLPKILYFGRYILIEERIKINWINKINLLKFLFVMYLIIFKQIRLMDLTQTNILFYHGFKIIDIDFNVKIPSKYLIIYYINEYFFKCCGFLYDNIGCRIDNWLIKIVNDKILKNNKTYKLWGKYFDS